MTRFAVWAPDAGGVDLVVGDERRPMEREGGGWWAREEPDLGPGTRYGFALDGGPVRPDPRSHSQPDGVLGRSEVVAESEPPGRRWPGRSLPGSVIYELHVGTFTEAGTFDGAIERLGHLVDLGIDLVEVLPIASFSGDRGWGYDGAQLSAVHRAYGGVEGFRRFVDACHEAGLGVVLDVVYNHLGPAGNFLGEFGPYFSSRHATNWGDGVNLDGPGSDEVRRYFIDDALRWLGELGVDGLRLDAVHALADDSAVHLLEQLAAEVEALAVHLGRPLFLIAESDRNDPRYVRSRDAGGYGLDAAWADEWHHALHAVLTGERGGYYEDFGTLEQLALALERAWVYAGSWSSHRGRTHGRPADGVAGHRFVVAVQNHDQVGNRAAGDRLGALVSPGRLRVAAALLLTSPFTPMLFQGEEWGASTPFAYFTDHQDPELGRLVTEGRRREFAHFGWDPSAVPDPQDPATFVRSKLDWAEREQEGHAALLAWYRELIALRRRHRDLSDPRLDRTTAVADDATQTIELQRGGARVLVNLGGELHGFERRPGEELLAASDASVRLRPGTVQVGPDAVAIVASAAPGDRW